VTASACVASGHGSQVPSEVLGTLASEFFAIDPHSTKGPAVEVPQTTQGKAKSLRRSPQYVGADQSEASQCESPEAFSPGIALHECQPTLGHVRRTFDNDRRNQPSPRVQSR
jgi:hypothetical protein